MAENPADPIVVADRMTEALGALTGQLARLEAGRLDNAAAIAALSEVRHRDKSHFRFLVIAVVFDLILSVALGVVGVEAYRASNVATRNHHAAVLQCQAGNEFRRADLERWVAITNLITPSGADRTPGQQATADGLLAIASKADALRDCSKIP